MNKQKLLLKINNQCSEVQISIAKHLDNPDSKKLNAKLSELRLLLNRFFDNA